MKVFENLVKPLKGGEGMKDSKIIILEDPFLPYHIVLLIKIFYFTTKIGEKNGKENK